MVLTEAERNARRRAGVDAMTDVEKIRRDITGGRPVSELKTPLAAVTAARTLHRELESRMTLAGLNPKPGDRAVSIGYISPDLSVIGFTPLYASVSEAALAVLEGHIMLGLVFGMVDRASKDGDGRVVLGIRPFLTTKQTEAWLSELLPIIRAEIQDPC
jgi:hypothetical protein